MSTEQSRADFEYQAGAALSLPVSIIEMARKGDGYDHAYDSMNIMQPLNGWWHWWKKSRETLKVEMPPIFPGLRANSVMRLGQLSYRGDVINVLCHAGITVEV